MSKAKYYQAPIVPCGYGLYIQAPPGGLLWHDEHKLLAAMRGNYPNLIELGVDELPARIPDIRGRIYYQKGRIFGYYDGGVLYVAVVAISKEDRCLKPRNVCPRCGRTKRITEKLCCSCQSL